MIIRFLFHGIISFFCIMGAFYSENNFWYTGALVALLVCVIYLFCLFFTSDSKFGSFIVDILIPCLSGAFLGFLVFDIGLIGSVFLSAASTVIVPIISTIFDL